MTEFRWWCHCCFYHGETSPYPYSLNWLDEFDDPQLARQLYTEAFPLVDITIVPDDEIMQHRRIALLELIQKAYSRPRFNRHGRQDHHAFG